MPGNAAKTKKKKKKIIEVGVPLHLLHHFHHELQILTCLTPLRHHLSHYPINIMIIMSS
jgi:hypothetical protein